MKSFNGKVICLSIFLALAIGGCSKSETEAKKEEMAEKAKEMKDKAAEGIEDAVDATKEAGSDLVEGSKEVWEDTKEASKEAWDATKEVSKEAWDSTKEAGQDLVDGAGEMASDAKTAVVGGAAAIQEKGEQLVEDGKQALSDEAAVFGACYEQVGCAAQDKIASSITQSACEAANGKSWYDSSNSSCVNF